MSAKSATGLRSKLVLGLVSSLITLLALEVVARVYIARIADREQFTRFATLSEYRERVGGKEWWFGLLAPHRYLGYAGAPNLVDGENRHNSMGFRGEEVPETKAPGEFRIACLGASTTYTILVRDHRQSYPAVLQDLLRERGFRNVTVVNAGVPAWSSYETLINYLLRIQDLDADLILVSQGFADVAARFVWPPEAFKGDNSGYFAPQFADPSPALYEASALLRILLVSSGRAMPASTMGRSVYNTATTSYYMEFSRQRFESRWPSGIFKRVPLTDMLAANSSIYFRRNTENLVINARERGVQAVLMSFAYSPRFLIYFGAEGLQEAVDEHNGILAEVARDQGVPFMNLKALFPEEKEYWGFDGIHVNEKGAVLKARLVADFLLEQGLLPK